MEVLGPCLGSSTLIADLSKVPGEVAGLITDRVIDGALGVLTSVASHYATMDFGAVRRGYAAGWSADQLCVLRQSLEPIVMVIAETTKWVKEARHMEREATWGGGSIQATRSSVPQPSQLLIREILRSILQRGSSCSNHWPTQMRCCSRKFYD
jgi:hypothetical protein